MTSKNKDDQSYGNDSGGWYQVSSKSDPCDSRGGVTKESQTVQQYAAAVAHPHTPTEKGKLSLENACETYDAYNQQAAPSHGGSVPAHKDVNEGQGANYPQNRNKTKIAGDGKATVRTVMDKPEFDAFRLMRTTT